MLWMRLSGRSRIPKGLLLIRIVLLRNASQRVVIAQRYRELLQPDITQYYDWIRDKLNIGTQFDTTPLLGPEQRETLALARFLWEQLDNIRAQEIRRTSLVVHWGPRMGNPEMRCTRNAQLCTPRDGSNAPGGHIGDIGEL